MDTSLLKKILLIEDDTDIQEIAKMALHEIGGFEVDIASSGKEALEKIVKDVPQLILLDVMMPEMDGPTTLQKLRELELAKTVPVIFMTAKVQPHEVEYYKTLGSKGVIAKPFDPLTLSEQVTELWKS